MNVTMDDTRRITNLLKDYRNGMELEIRIPANRKTFESMYNGLLASELTNKSIQRTVNIISTDVFEKSNANTKYIRSFEYTNGLGVDTYYQKRLIGRVRVNASPKYSVVLSEESACARFTQSTTALVRCKLRFSATADVWRYDITATRSGILSQISQQLSNIKEALISATPDTFLAVAANFDTYEVEIEYVGNRKPVIGDMTIVTTAFAYMDPSHVLSVAHATELTEMSAALGLSCKLDCTFRQIMNQAMQMSKLMYNDIYPLTGYYATVKIDGERACIRVMGNRYKIIYSNRLVEIPVETYVPGESTILDVEMYEGVAYIIDIIQLRSEHTWKLPFNARLALMDDAAAVLADVIKVGKKQYLKINAIEDTVKSILNTQYDHPTDGIMFTQDGKNYMQTANYKWKSFEDNTIDFIVKKCPSKLIGRPPYMPRDGYNIYLLFAQIGHSQRQTIGIGFMDGYSDLFPRTDPVIYPIQFSPSASPLAYIWITDMDVDCNRVVELGKNEDLTWRFVDYRDDKSVGNNFRVAEQTYMNFIDRFNVEDLWIPNSAYFTLSKDKTHWAETKYKRIVISTTFKEYFSHLKWIIDLAGGRGADIHAWKNIGVHNVLFVDIDKSAIVELLRRKYELKRVQGGAEKTVSAYDSAWDYNYEKTIIKKNHGMTIHTLVADLKMPYQSLLAQYRQYGLSTEMVDGMNCSFGLHYMCDTLEHINNLLTAVHKMLKVGASFVFTVMDGSKVFNLLASDDVWERTENLVVKYRIRKNYASTVFAKCGQEISVLLPMSSEEKVEPLCNITAVVAIAKKLGFVLTKQASFMEYSEFVEANARSVHDALTPADKEYIELYSVVILEKRK